MSDNAGEPGAPSAKGAEKAAEKVTSKNVSVPGNNALSLLKEVDRTILRLNKLLANPGGLSTFLSTFNYTLYVLAYLQTKSPSLANLARKLLSAVKSSAQPSVAAAAVDGAAVPPIAALASMISRARTTLRLFGTFPLYAWLRSLATGPKPGSDPVLHRIAFLQASSYFTYQILENILTLADNGIVPKSFVALINRGNPETARPYLWAYRAWLGGVSCDFLRLAREAQLENQKRAARSAAGQAVEEFREEDKRVDAKWWTDLMIASAWLPMALHFSSLTGGVPGFNMGWMGVCGLVAGSTRAKALWAATLQ